MVTFNFAQLLIVAVVALAAPLLAELVPGRLLPPVVIEVVLGIVVGPEVLGWVHHDAVLAVLNILGLGFLLFLAGLELDPASIRSGLGGMSSVAYAATLVLAIPLAIIARVAGAGGDVRILALAMTSTSLGVIVPVLLDAKESTSPFGQAVLVGASIGEFASLFLLTLLFSADPKSTPVQILYVVCLIASAAVAAVVITHWWGSRWFRATRARLDNTTSQFRVRAAFVLLALFAGLADRFGVDAVLGAFVAGLVLRVAEREADNRYEAKLHAIGYGFLVPVFFIDTGVKLDVHALVHDTRTLALVPLFVAAMALARGAPAIVLFRRRFPLRTAVAAASLQTTSLTFPIIAATIGLSLHLVTPGTAAALVAAGLVSVVIFPMLALVLRPWSAAISGEREGRAAGRRTTRPSPGPDA